MCLSFCPGDLCLERGSESFFWCLGKLVYLENTDINVIKVIKLSQGMPTHPSYFEATVGFFVNICCIFIYSSDIIKSNKRQISKSNISETAAIFEK